MPTAVETLNERNAPTRTWATPLAGQTGLGKSTLVNTIFASHLVDSKGRFEVDEPVRQTTEIQAASHGQTLAPFMVLSQLAVVLKQLLLLHTVIQEGKVKLRLNIVDTPGYGDLVNNEGWCAGLVMFLSFLHLGSFFFFSTAGILSSSTSKTNTRLTSARSSPPPETDTFKTLASTAASTSLHPAAIP